MAKGEALLALLAPKHGAGDDMGSDSGSDKPESPYAQSARDFFEAAKKGDFDAAGEALETCILHCMHGMHDEDQEKGEPEE